MDLTNTPIDHDASAQSAADNDAARVDAELQAEAERTEQRKAERKAYKEKRRFNAATFLPSASHPYTERAVPLNSSYAQKLFLGLFPRAQLTVYGIQVMLPIIGRDDNNDAVESILLKMLETQLTAIKNETARIHKLLRDNSTEVNLKYTDAKTFTTNIYVPTANRMLSILEHYDRLNEAADAAWHAGLLTSTQRKTVSSSWRRAIAKLVREMHSIYMRSKAAARRDGERRKNEENERRRARATRVRRPAVAAASAETVVEASAVESEDTPVGDVLGPLSQAA